MNSSDKKFIQDILQEVKAQLSKDVAHYYQNDKMDYESFKGLINEIEEQLIYIKQEVVNLY